MRYEFRVEESDGGLRIVHENGFLEHLTPEEHLASADARSVIHTHQKQSQIFGREGHRNLAWFLSEKGRDRVRVASEQDSAIGFLSMLHGFELDDRAGERRMDFSVSAKFAEMLKRDAVQYLQLDSRKLRRASRPNGDDGSRLADDGSNLPRVLKKLKSDQSAWEQWLKHVRLALPELDDIRIAHREDDRHDYLMVKHGGVEVPSWAVSEGTLRLFALTAIAYLQVTPMAYLLEEPENGIHPMAIEFAYQALSTVYGAQVFIASHSPTLLRCVEPDQVLCFGHDSKKGTVIIPGNEHPRRQEWQGSVDEAVFWAADILK